MKQLPKEITSLMKKALAGTIEHVFDDLSGHTEEVPDFIGMMPEFTAESGPKIWASLFELDFMNDEIAEEVSS